MKDLNNYHLPADQSKIQFDQHGRPYVQEDYGRMMLSHKGKYEY